METVRQLLEWVIGSGGAGIITYALLEEFGGGLTAKGKRYTAIIGTIAFVVAAYAVAAQFGYRTMPSDLQAWVESVAPFVALALGINQAIHGARQL